VTRHLRLVQLEQSDTHPWWACHCDRCAADRKLFLGDTIPTEAVDAAKKLILIRGERS
jgi:hypothetical protein